MISKDDFGTFTIFEFIPYLPGLPECCASLGNSYPCITSPTDRAFLSSTRIVLLNSGPSGISLDDNGLAIDSEYSAL